MRQLQWTYKIISEMDVTCNLHVSHFGICKLYHNDNRLCIGVECICMLKNHLSAEPHALIVTLNCSRVAWCNINTCRAWVMSTIMVMVTMPPTLKIIKNMGMYCNFIHFLFHNFII